MVSEGRKEGKFRLLWVDDEIELLQPHILYLQQREFEVTPVHSGEDALHLLAREQFDLVLLDERMPGLDGLTVLERLRSMHSELPVVMVTKQEEEELMEEAIGRSVTDFLTKPVNPSQVLSVCKRILESSRLREEVITRDYTREFSRLSNQLAGGFSAPAEWGDLAEALAFWSIQLDLSGQEGLAESLAALMQEADGVLARQVIEDYPGWVSDNRPWQTRMQEAVEDASGTDLPAMPAPADDRPILVTDLLGSSILPLISLCGRVVLVVLDCLRLDQWLAMEPLVAESSRIERVPVFSLLPSASPYSRNALLSGRFPDEIAGDFPDLWEGYGSGRNDEHHSDEVGLNRYEPQMLAEAIDVVSNLIGNVKLALFERIKSPADAQGIERRLSGGVPGGLSVIVVNFLDLLVHGQSESAVVQELAPDPAAFRALAVQWFERSPISRMINRAVAGGVPVLVATDHGSIQVRRGVEVKADRTASSGVRYKVGRNLNADARWTHRIDDMPAWRLPRHGLTSTYMLSREDSFLVFSADAAAHRRRFNRSFQHGGISLSELIIPFIRITQA